MIATEVPGLGAFSVCSWSLSWCFGSLGGSGALICRVRDFDAFAIVDHRHVSRRVSLLLPTISRVRSTGPVETPRLAWRPLGFLTHWNRGSSRHRELRGSHVESHPHTRGRSQRRMVSRPDRARYWIRDHQ